MNTMTPETRDRDRLIEAHENDEHDDTNVEATPRAGCPLCFPPPPVMPPEINARITHALTQYDIRASKRPGHSIWAPSHYFRALETAEARMRDEGMTLRQALVKSFTGRLLDVVLKAAGEPASTDAEQRY